MIINPNKTNRMTQNVPCSEFWIEDSALFYERWTRRGNSYYKYTIVNDELKKFSCAKIKVIDVLFILIIPYITIPLFLLQRCFIKRHMKKVWKEKRNLIYEK